MSLGKTWLTYPERDQPSLCVVPFVQPHCGVIEANALDACVISARLARVHRAA
jgi:hypothetical protein